MNYTIGQIMFQKGRIYSVFLGFYDIMKNEKNRIGQRERTSYRFIRFPTELIRSDLLGCYHHAVNENDS